MSANASMRCSTSSIMTPTFSLSVIASAPQALPQASLPAAKPGTGRCLTLQVYQRVPRRRAPRARQKAKPTTDLTPSQNPAPPATDFRPDLQGHPCPQALPQESLPAAKPGTGRGLTLQVYQRVPRRRAPRARQEAKPTTETHPPPPAPNLDTDTNSHR